LNNAIALIIGVQRLALLQEMKASRYSDGSDRSQFGHDRNCASQCWL